MNPGTGWEEELRQRLHGIFMGEAAERLEALEGAVRAVEGGATGGDVDRHLADAHRQAHTLKGGARAVGLADVERLSDSLEALLGRLRGGAEAGPGTWPAVSAGVETIRARLAGEPADVDAVVSALSALAASPG